jgi:hypothetical protein
MLAEAGVCCVNIEPGARDCRCVLELAKGLFETERLAVDMPISARLLPEDDRWKFGCCGRPIVGLMEVDRAC